MIPTSRPLLGLSICLFMAVVHAVPYSKYGRTCNDIGCLSSEVCVMAHDSCSYSQQENKDCGRYPTCKKSGGGSSNQGGSSFNLNPSPDNTRVSTSNQAPSNYNPNYGQAPPPQAPYNPNLYPQLPGGGGGQPPYNQPPYGGVGQQPYPYPGQYPQYPNYNNNGYNGGGYGGNNRPPFGNIPTSFFNIPTTTEPSLWHQFLNNKRGNGAARNHGQMAMSLVLAAITAMPFVRRILFA